MKDVHTAFKRATFEALNGVISCKVYTDEAPNDILDKVYVVISGASSSNTSTKNSADRQASIDIDIQTWETGYNTSATADGVADEIYDILNPGFNSNLDLSAYGMQMMNLKDTQDNTSNLGELEGRKYITRTISFQCDIFIY